MQIENSNIYIPQVSLSTSPCLRRSEMIGVFYKNNEIIENDTRDDTTPEKQTPINTASNGKTAEECSTTSPSLPMRRPLIKIILRKPTLQLKPLSPKPEDMLICYDAKSQKEEAVRSAKRHSEITEHTRNAASLEPSEKRRKININICATEYKNHHNIPSCGANKPEERCKYHPNCTTNHTTAACKSFPNCKFADKCMYSHPKCKYDTACTNLDCNFSHSGTRNPLLQQPTVPSKSISSLAASAASAMCKYYPNCTKVGCTFYHPKPCRFGENCINKMKCSFYHQEIQTTSKFKCGTSYRPKPSRIAKNFINKSKYNYNRQEKERSSKFKWVASNAESNKAE